MRESLGVMLVALALGAADGASASARATAGSGPTAAADRPATATMKVGGHVRRFVVAGPPRGVRPRGVLVGLHGGGRFRTGREFGRDVGLLEQGVARGWVVVLPDGLRGQFHAGDCCGGRAKSGRTDDLRFVTSAVRYARHRYRARRGPVVATGFSTGGFMAYRLACQTRLVAAIAVVAGLDVTGERCRPRRAISVLHVHALDDRNVPYGGRFSFGGLGERRGVQALTRSWARLGRCERLVTSDDGDLRTRRATRCRRGVHVETITTRTGGHAWSGAGEAYGPGSPALDTTATVLAFFER